MTKLSEIPTKKFPLTIQKYRKIKDEIVSAAEGFEEYSQSEIAGDLYKIADALDALMSKISNKEGSGF